MALHIPLGRIARTCLCAARPRASSLADGGGACGTRDADVPACAPCCPAPQPACRARPAAVRCAQRVVCCAPPQGSRPPCPPRDPICPLTCSDFLDQNRELSNQARGGFPPRNEFIGGDCEQDPVAQRLQLARRARQEEYEQEVANRCTCICTARLPTSAPYRLGGERECARATDGCMYAVPHAPATPRRGCGPGRMPPPPRCVELAPDDGCRIKGDAHLDPCAHRPRVMIEIDRSANTMMKNATPAVTPTVTCGGGSGAKRAGDTSWCANPPPPVAAPQRCRRPTIVERLRARSAPHLPDSHNKRRLHTSVTYSKAVGSVSGGLEGMIRSKEQLKEAGRGRVVVNASASRTRQVKPPGGRLELCVPPGTKRVAVQVSLDGGAGGTCDKMSPPDTVPPAIGSSAPACAQRSSSPCSNFTTTSAKRDPWQRIKKIQKKFTGGQCDKGSAGFKAGSPSVGAACPVKSTMSPLPCPPCAPSPGIGRDSASPAPCAIPTSKSSGCRPPVPAGCEGSPTKPKRETKRCSSTSAFLANTIIVN